MNILDALKHIAEHGGEAHSHTCRYRIRLCNNGIFRKKLDLQGNTPWTDKDYPVVMNMQILHLNDWSVIVPQPAAPPPESPQHEEVSQTPTFKQPTLSNTKYE